MQVIRRDRIESALREAGLDPWSRDFLEPENVHRVSVFERCPPEFVKGPHRKAVHSGGRKEDAYPVCNRPVLADFVPRAFAAVQAPYVLAVIPDGALWLNNKAQMEYLYKVADAQAVGRFLRSRGLCDRFRGAFRVARGGYHELLPKLAANPFSGGCDVLFVAGDSVGLTVLACQHFDLHIASPSRSLLQQVLDCLDPEQLQYSTAGIPEDPALTAIWTDELN